MIRPEQLADALDRIDPRDRELLSLSLRRRVPDEALGRLYECAPSEVARRRARAIERLADEMELQRGEDLGAVLKALLEPGTWTQAAATLGEEFAAGGGPLAPGRRAARPRTTSPQAERPGARAARRRRRRRAAEAPQRRRPSPSREPEPEPAAAAPRPSTAPGSGARHARRARARGARPAAARGPAGPGRPRHRRAGRRGRRRSAPPSSATRERVVRSAGGGGGEAARATSSRDKGGPLAAPVPDRARATTACYSTAVRAPSRPSSTASPAARGACGSRPRPSGARRACSAWSASAATGSACRPPSCATARSPGSRASRRASTACSWSLHADLSKRTLFVRHDGRTVTQAARRDRSPRQPHAEGPLLGHGQAQGDRRGARPTAAACSPSPATRPTCRPYWPGGDRLAVHATDDESSIGQPGEPRLHARRRPPRRAG